MKTSKNIFILMLICLTPFTFTWGQVTGYWKVMDERDGVEKSIIEIYEVGELYYGRIYKLLPSSKRTHCEKCDGEMKDKPLTGMVILTGLKKTSNGGTGGKVLNPDNGKFYPCFIELESADRLKIRGYLGVPSMGKTQYWNRSTDL